MNNKKGFTLTEILVVIAIIGLLIAIAIPSIGAVRKRINKRLFEEKKSEILTAAELYAKDKNYKTDTIIYVYTLLENNYINNDVEKTDSSCTGDHISKGCVINPIDNSTLNDNQILIRVSSNTSDIVAIWGGDLNNSSDSRILVELVKEKLGCSSQDVKDGKCIFGYNKDTDSATNEPDVNNYLYYSGVMWRVLGVYYIDNKEVAKLISDDSVTWEITSDTSA